MSDPRQGEAYTEYVAAELAEEHRRRDNLQGRSQWLVTSSAVLLTLMSGIAVFIQFSEPVAVPGWLRVGYVLALAALVAAVAFGIWAGRAYRYRVADGSTLALMLGEHWGDDHIDARNLVAKLRVAEIVSLRHGNNLMAKWTLAGQVAQLVFVVLFAVCALLTAAEATPNG
ncbi:hypothetical protein [Glycomyces sp. NRRL B-16210]|uniref:hypothetical protein n=1 Tax=Glycomyces sp. NRRL B-16210 TaxID=1463821 RepID=UPI0004C287C3|nr:hypothetical protein [Glycomyces sp. NRRL B-16210]